MPNVSAMHDQMDDNCKVSIMARISSGIGPMFAISFVRHVLEGAMLFEVSPLFEKAAGERGIYSQSLMTEVAKKGNCSRHR